MSNRRINRIEDGIDERFFAPAGARCFRCGRPVQRLAIRVKGAEGEGVWLCGGDIGCAVMTTKELAADLLALDRQYRIAERYVEGVGVDGMVISSTFRRDARGEVSE